MGHDVFISYSSKDKAIADAACARLEQRGLRCWMAPRDLLPGNSYPTEIRRGIEGCRVFVVVYTASYNASDETLAEVHRAVKEGKHVIPFRLEDVPMSVDMEHFLATRHWLDAMNPPLEAHLERLVEVVGRVLGAGASSPPKHFTTGATGSPVPSKKGSRSRASLIAGVTIGLLGVVVLAMTFGDLFSRRSSSGVISSPAGGDAAKSPSPTGAVFAPPTPALETAPVPVTSDTGASGVAKASGAGDAPTSIRAPVVATGPSLEKTAVERATPTTGTRLTRDELTLRAISLLVTSKRSDPASPLRETVAGRLQFLDGERASVTLHRRQTEGEAGVKPDGAIWLVMDTLRSELRPLDVWPADIASGGLSVDPGSAIYTLSKDDVVSYLVVYPKGQHPLRPRFLGESEQWNLVGTRQLPLDNIWTELRGVNDIGRAPVELPIGDLTAVGDALVLGEVFIPETLFARDDLRQGVFTITVNVDDQPPLWSTDLTLQRSSAHVSARLPRGARTLQLNWIAANVQKGTFGVNFAGLRLMSALADAHPSEKPPAAATPPTAQAPPSAAWLATRSISYLRTPVDWTQSESRRAAVPGSFRFEVDGQVAALIAGRKSSGTGGLHSDWSLWLDLDRQHSSFSRLAAWPADVAFGGVELDPTAHIYETRTPRNEIEYVVVYPEGHIALAPRFEERSGTWNLVGTRQIPFDNIWTPTRDVRDAKRGPASIPIADLTRDAKVRILGTVFFPEVLMDRAELKGHTFTVTIAVDDGPPVWSGVISGANPSASIDGLLPKGARTLQLDWTSTAPRGQFAVNFAGLRLVP